MLDRLGVTDPAQAARYAQGRVSVGLAYATTTAARTAAEAVLLAVVKRDSALVADALRRALMRDDEEDPEEADTRRLVLCRLLVHSLRTSLTTREHALAQIPLRRRIEALDILDHSQTRPVLRATAATWVLVGD